MFIQPDKGLKTSELLLTSYAQAGGWFKEFFVNIWFYKREKLISTVNPCFRDEGVLLSLQKV